MKLFTSFNMGGLTLRNRVVLAPLTRGRSGPERIPNEMVIRYYTQRSSAGLLITEATSISDQGNGWAESAGIYTPQMRDGWAKVTESVHRQGGLIFCQLWHTGRASHTSFQVNNQPIVAPSAIAIVGEGVYGQDGKKYPHEVPRALETSEIPGIVQDYKNAARFAKEAGFDGVEVHSANGYLIDQFLQTCSNKRTDQYGGSVENRCRFLGEILAAITEVWPSERVGVRLSPNGAYNGMGSADNTETFTFVLQQLDKLRLSYAHLMDGLGFGYHNLCPPFTLEYARKHFSAPLIGNVGYTKDSAEEAISKGHADLIAFGRPFIGNPDLVERFKNNWPLVEASPATWFTHTDEGYSDYPPFDPTANL